MSISPKVTGKKLIKALCKNGFYLKRQKGSHAFVENSVDPKISTTIPNTPFTLPVGTLTVIRKQLKFSDEDFNIVLNQC
jgi:predicted RNA binding protein YcfA (HicA-like mRNA interferase family)